MKQFPILRSIERVPGGLMVVPMLIGATIVTFAPGTSKFFGSFTEALFSGALTNLAVFYVCMGTTIELTATPYSEAAKSATVLVAASVVVTAIVVPLVTAWWAGCIGSPSADGSSTTEGSAAAPTRREPH